MKRDLKYGLKSKRIKTICEICLSTLPSRELEQHRIIPREPYTDDNVIIVCDRCHHMIHYWIRHCKTVNDSYQSIVDTLKRMMQPII